MGLELLSYAAIGSLAGFFAGLLGLGGGAIVGPLLIFVYSDLLRFETAYIAHMAVATACGVIVFTAPISAATHARQHNVDWRLARLLGVGVVIGALISARSAMAVPGELIKILLIIFLISNTVNMLLPRQHHDEETRDGADALPVYELLPVASGVGVISALLGIGGGALIVPYLNQRKVFIRRAIGTSAFVGFPLSAAAAAGYIWAGQTAPQLPPGSWGYVYLPALFGISVFSIGAAYCGAQLTNKLSSALLRKIFALLTATIALRLLWSMIQNAG